MSRSQSKRLDHWAGETCDSTQCETPNSPKCANDFNREGKEISVKIITILNMTFSSVGNISNLLTSIKATKKQRDDRRSFKTSTTHKKQGT